MNRALRVTREAIERRSQVRTEAAERQASFVAARRPGNEAIIDLAEYVASYDPVSVASGVVATGATSPVSIVAGSWPRRFFATLSGTGAVSATVELWGTNSHDGDTLLATFTMAGTDSDLADAWVETTWASVWIDVTALSGTGASISMTAEC